MLFKILPFIALIGIGIKILAGIAALNAQKKRLKAKQEGRLEQYYADKETFWRNVDRISMFAIAATVIWYMVGVFFWISGS